MKLEVGWDYNYGHFIGGDPRNFTPDEDASTEAERAAHAEACERWNRGDCEPKAPHEHGPHGPGPYSPSHVTYAGFGLGVNRVRMDDGE